MTRPSSMTVCMRETAASISVWMKSSLALGSRRKCTLRVSSDFPSVLSSRWRMFWYISSVRNGVKGAWENHNNNINDWNNYKDIDSRIFFTHCNVWFLQYTGCTMNWRQYAGSFGNKAIKESHMTWFRHVVQSNVQAINLTELYLPLFLVYLLDFCFLLPTLPFQISSGISQHFLLACCCWEWHLLFPLSQCMYQSLLKGYMLSKSEMCIHLQKCELASMLSWKQVHTPT